MIHDNQVDAVVSTLTLSSCKNVDQVLREIRRILKPVSAQTFPPTENISFPLQGGVFLYMENIRSNNFFLAFLQFLCAPFYHFIFGISLIRNIPGNIERAHFPGGTTQRIFLARGIPLLLRPHVCGIARK